MSYPLLTEYLRESASEDFAYGAHDCGLFLADWLIRNGYIDTAAPYRGRYSTKVGFEAICPLGVVRAAQRGAKAAGLASTEEPHPGDVGVIRAAWGATGAIKTRNGWAMLSDEGLAFTRDVEAIRAWRVECIG